MEIILVLFIAIVASVFLVSLPFLVEKIVNQIASRGTRKRLPELTRTFSDYVSTTDTLVEAYHLEREGLFLHLRYRQIPFEKAFVLLTKRNNEVVKLKALGRGELTCPTCEKEITLRKEYVRSYCNCPNNDQINKFLKSNL